MLLAIKPYIWLHYFLLKNFGYNLKGLGFVQRFIRQDHTIKYDNKLLHYSSDIYGSYDHMLIGKSNEPETHLFFNNIIPAIEDDISFIDVGTSVGEMLFSVAEYPNVKYVIGFEPRNECVVAILKSIELNQFSNIVIYNKAIGDAIKEVEFYSINGGSGSGISLNDGKTTQSFKVKMSTLDLELPLQMDNPIMLIDVEGAEPLVLKGGLDFIKRNRPLIIFEYNEVSKAHFSIVDIFTIIGKEYQIYRLKGDGTLDKDLRDTWNCVAVPSDSIFQTTCQKLIAA